MQTKSPLEADCRLCLGKTGEQCVTMDNIWFDEERFFVMLYMRRQILK